MIRANWRAFSGRGIISYSMPTFEIPRFFTRNFWLAACLFAACGEPAGESKTPPGATDISGYRGWTYRRLGVVGAGHGGGNIYANDVAQNFLSKAAPAGVTTNAVLSYPEHSMIVYERRKNGAYVENLVMRKTRDPPARAKSYAGWSWAKRTSPGGLDAYQGDACVKCHDEANAESFRDGVHVFPDCRKEITCP